MTWISKSGPPHMWEHPTTGVYWVLLVPGPESPRNRKPRAVLCNVWKEGVGGTTHDQCRLVNVGDRYDFGRRGFQAVAYWDEPVAPPVPPPLPDPRMIEQLTGYNRPSA